MKPIITEVFDNIKDYDQARRTWENKGLTHMSSVLDAKNNRFELKMIDNKGALQYYQNIPTTKQ